MSKIAKFAIVGIAGVTIWWLAFWLTSRPEFWFDLDWPHEVGGLTAKFVTQLLTVLILSIPPFVMSCMIFAARAREKKGRSGKRGESNVL